jgi:oligopeptide transport system substrate-binding protein
VKVRPLAAIVAGLAALWLTCGCARESHRPPCPPGALCLAYGNGAEPTSLDPAFVDGTWEANIVGELIEGLTRTNASGHTIPGMAYAWETSPDGLTWTFHLRRAFWSDGTPVTASDFVYGVRRILDPKTASYSAFILFPFLKNAQAVNAKRMPLSAAGIEAPDPKTVVIRLSHPWPLLATYASGRILWPVPRWAVERWGDKWTQPAHYVVNGPYRLMAWRLGDAVVIDKNPRYWDPARICYSEVDFNPSTDAITNERSVRAGDLDVSTTVQSNRVAFLRRSPLRNYLRLAPEFGVTYLPFNLKDPALKDVRVRQALSMAIDREFIARKLLRGGQTPAYSAVPPDMPGYDNGPKTYWASWSLAQRQAEARRLLAEAGYGPRHPLKVTVKHRNSSDPLLYLPAVQADWRAIGVDAQLQQNDVQIAYQAYEMHDFQVGDAGWVSNDPLNYLDLNRSDTGGQNYGQYKNPAFDHELDAALDSADPAQRTQHMMRAERMLLDDAPFAPVYFISSRNLVDPKISGWIDNPIDTHPISRLCRAPSHAASGSPTP